MNIFISVLSLPEEKKTGRENKTNKKKNKIKHILTCKEK
jgi:hypothetical protein